MPLRPLFNLADREGVACQHNEAAALCQTTLAQMREKAVFALKLTRIEGPLPHAKEVKVQTGGLFGLQHLMGNTGTDAIDDITRLLETAVVKYGSVEQLPYETIARSIVQFEGRSRNRSRE